MAKKRKQEDVKAGSPAWMATFSDLMNLLLCFFVLLFSMSSVDTDKYEALLASLTGNFSVFSSGSSMVGESIYVASGANQMVQISDYFTEYSEDGGKDGIQQFQNLEQYEKELENQQKAEVEQLYDDISQRAENAQLDGMVTVEKDEGNQYVKISIGGAILFNSGEADLKKDAKAILSKVGDILKLYDSHLIKIEGHTDNVPITSGKFRSNLQLSLARAESVFEYMESQKKLNPVTLEASGRGEYIPISDNQTVEGRAKNRRVEFKIYTESAK